MPENGEFDFDHDNMLEAYGEDLAVVKNKDPSQLTAVDKQMILMKDIVIQASFEKQF